MRYYLSLLLILLSTSAHAITTIDITRGNADPVPIALPYLAGSDPTGASLGKSIIEVTEKDLERSGLFRSVDRSAFMQKITGSDTVPDFPSWRPLNAAALITGGITPKGDQFDAKFRLWDVFAQSQLTGKSYTTNTANSRRIGHLIADEIYHHMTGEIGYFDTRIVYVAESGPALKRVKRLAIMDQDGENHRYLTDGRSLVMTPRFSPAKDEVIYLSYRDGTPRVYIRHVDTGRESLVGQFAGMSFAPRFAPDGKSVILSASVENANSEIFTMDLRTREQRRLTNDPAIDTSPSFSPDGDKITFNSDRGGSQQIYVMDKNGGGVKRISFGTGKYATPVWSPRGDLIAFTKMYQGQFYIGVMRPDGSGERILSQSFLEEGPTWSPNGRVIMFARQTPTRGSRAGDWHVYSIDLTGYNERLVPTPGEASDPAWSSLL